MTVPNLPDGDKDGNKEPLFRVGGTPTPYPEVYGEPRLRSAIANYVSRLGLDPEAWNIIVTNGGTGALDAIFKTLHFLGLGTAPLRVAMITPTWMTIPHNQIKLLGGSSFEVPMTFSAGAWTLDVEQASKIIAAEGANCVFLVNPSNPTGHVLPPNDLDGIIASSMRAGAYTIVDITYDAMTHYTRHVDLAVTNKHAESTFLVGSLSKTFGIPGHRVGFALVPKPMTELVGEAVKCASLGVNVPAQAIAARALEEWVRTDAAWFNDVRDALWRRRAIVCRGLEDLGFELAWPEGTYYAFPALPQNYPHSAMEFCAKLSATHGVELVPGNDFGQFPRHVRISFANTRDEAKLQLAIERIAAALT